METKEKPVGKPVSKSPAKRPRPAANTAQEPRKRPAPQKRPASQKRPAAQERSAPQAQNDEVFIPAEETREERNRPERRSGDAPQKRRGGKQKPKAEPTYRPYRQANAMEKRRKNADFKLRLKRFFSAENPIAKYFYKEDPNVFGSQDDPNAARKKKREAAKRAREKRAERWNMPATMYIQPLKFNSRRLAIQLATVLAVVLALVMGMSVFFKVKVITVTGANVYSAWTVREQSGINLGDNLLTFGRTKASGQIIANLPYVKSARIGIRLPDTVNIEIEEAAVVYSIQDQDGVWWLINSDGKVVEQTSTANSKNYTQVLGITLYEPHKSEPGVALDEMPTQTEPDGTVIPVLVTSTQRLQAALTILQALEANDIVGDAASVDVSQLQDIILWYGTQYQVNLGTIERMDYKIAYMKNAILQMSDYQSGVLDVSFTTWTDSAGFTPFG